MTPISILVCAAIGIAGTAQQSAAADSAYLESALQCANWLDSVARTEQGTTFWPIAPDESDQATEILYSGTSGVVLFYLEMYRATNREHFLAQASSGGDWLLDRVDGFDAQSNQAFWTGVAGVGYVLDRLHRATQEERFKLGATRCYELVCQTATKTSAESAEGVRWNEVTDIIGGSAGIGFYLLDQAARHKQPQSLELAVAAGDGLISAGIPAETSQGRGLRWKMSDSFPREMPNYSHGTAGISDFLLALDQACRTGGRNDNYDGRFLEAAVAGARYLASLAETADNKGRIPHNFPDGPNLYYLGWCHGPSGTVRFLDRLAATTQEPRWNRLADKMTAALMESEIPATRPSGFWENVGLCCGNAGAASFLLQRFQRTGNTRELALAELLSQDLRRRATRVELPGEEVGLKWEQAEHRVRPELVQAQTGLMQGAAGVGLWFLKMHAHQNGHSLDPELPLFPY